MRICKISEVLGRVGEQISGVSGTLKSVWKAKTGEGQYGPWSLQDAVLVDDSGEMTITFANFDDMSMFRDKQVNITAKQGDKGLSGLIVKESEYKGKKYIKLHVTGSAMIDSGVTHETTGEVKNPTPTLNLPQEVDPEEQAALDILAKKKAEKEALRLQEEAQVKARQLAPSKFALSKSLTNRDVQIVNLFRKALKGAVWACDKENVPFYTESVATLFIAMRDDNLTDSMPVEFEARHTPEEVAKILSTPRESIAQPDPEPAIDQEPKTWQDVVVHVEGRFKGFPLGIMKSEAIEEVFNTFKPKMNPKTNNYEMQDLYLKNALISWSKEVL